MVAAARDAAAGHGEPLAQARAGRPAPLLALLHTRPRKRGRFAHLVTSGTVRHHAATFWVSMVAITSRPGQGSLACTGESRKVARTDFTCNHCQTIRMVVCKHRLECFAGEGFGLLVPGCPSSVP